MNNRRLIWAAVIVLAVFVGYRIFIASNAPKKIITERIVPVVIAAPTIGSIEEKLALTGDIKGETEINVTPKTIGRIEEIYVDEGDEVRKGNKLLSFVAGIKPDNDLYEDVVVFAPVSGVVGVQYIKLGQQVSTGTPLFTIYQIDNVKVMLDVPEKYFSLLRRGIPARISLDAMPGRLVYGKVTDFRPVIDPLSRTAQVEILIPNLDHKIKPGMFCKVDLILKSRSNVIKVPADAVLGDEQKYVFIVVDGKAVKKNIGTGIQEDNTIEVAYGLRGNEPLIVVGQRVVDDGIKVEVKTND